MYHPLHLIFLVISCFLVSNVTKKLVSFAKYIEKANVLSQNILTCTIVECFDSSESVTSCLNNDFQKENIFPSQSDLQQILYARRFYNTRHIVLHYDLISDEKLSNFFQFSFFSAACDKLTQSLSKFQLSFQKNSFITVTSTVIKHSGMDSLITDGLLHESDVISYLTSRSTSLWNVANSNCNVDVDCLELYFTIIIPNNYTSRVQVVQNFGGHMSSDDGFAISDRRGSFVIMNNELELDENIALAEVILLQNRHLKHILDLPSHNTIDQDVSDTLSDEFTAHTALLSLSLLYEETERTLSTVHTTHVKDNAMLLVDVLADAQWLWRYRGVVDRFVAVQDTILDLHSRKRCEDMTGERNHSMIMELYHEMSDVHSDAMRLLHSSKDFSDLSALPLLTRSEWPLEQYFALIAPYWLPLMVPLFKAMRTTSL